MSDEDKRFDRELLRIRFQTLTIMWETVARWFAKARGAGPGYVAPHNRREARKLAEKSYDRFGVEVEKLIVDAHEHGIPIGDWVIIGPEQRTFEKRRPGRGFKEAA